MLVAAVAVLAPASPAASVTKKQVSEAKAELGRIADAIADKRAQLDEIQADAADLAFTVDEANGELANVQAQLAGLREQLDEVRTAYETRVGLLEDRAREAFMSGSGSNLDFILGASSITDLSDRAAFVDQVTAADSDIAAEVALLHEQLELRARELTKLENQQRRAIDALFEQQTLLEAQFDAQQDILDAIEADKARQEEAVRKLGKQYREKLLAQQGYSGKIGNGVLKVCPVDAPVAFGDSFGAPRYTGGYHPHAGNDMFAPVGTPIRATFPGMAVDATNTIGGLSVKVLGETGETYNAHLSALGKLGPVQTGDIIGYVGASGNAAGTPSHNHFEYRPKTIPSPWPESTYGYSVVGDSINPYPLLTAVC
ncbi:MAG: peptidoglycan DD-metalloendopeptidase family protein [Actinomycetota bacterium]